MTWADLPPALATGAVDGQENPMPIFIMSKLNTLNQKYVTLWHYIADPLIFGVNETVWNGWSEEDRKIVREAAQEAAKHQIDVARRGMSDNEVIAELGKLNVTVTVLTPQERALFRAAVKPAYDKWAKIIGEDLVTKAERISAGK
jgi:TRAP-type C4-dicarboxylate transport system substrate-binding protein